MIELILFLGMLAGIALVVGFVALVFKVLFHVAMIPLAIAWGLVKVVGFVILGVLFLVLAPVIVGPLLIVALVAAVVLAPFFFLAALVGLA